MNKLSITSEGKTVTTEFEESCMQDLIPAFVGGCVATGFTEHCVKIWLQKYLNDELYD